MVIDEKLASHITTAVISLITGLIGIFITNYRYKNEYGLSIYMKQISEAYGPVMSIILSCNWQLSQNVIERIDDLICEHNAIIAPSVLRFWQQYKVRRDDGSKEQFKLSLLSNYNWVKKCLEYPYIEDEIQMKYIPIHHWNRNQALRAVVVSFVLLIVLVAVYSKSDNGLIQSFALFACIPNFFFLMYWASDLLGKAGRK